ncbi:MAG: NUDIX domain-containing protein [Chloroflexi bacterium]|nr:NUDIX domain-containing protein [Chloroflexota bacterium]
MKPIRNSAKALIVDGGKVLAIKLSDKDGFWYTLPGGGQEPGEDLHATLRRECLEEAGIEIKVGGLVFVREYIGKNHEFADRHSDYHGIEFIFECSLAEGAKPQTGSLPDVGQLAVEWLELDKVDNYRLYPLALRPLIKRIRERRAAVYMGDVN